MFSRKYAESTWCLDELCLMLETGAPIISVFYDVIPSGLRWIEKGEYASAVLEHEKKHRFDSQTISVWKLALREAAGNFGLDFHSDTIKGDWALLLKGLEDAVLNNLKPVAPGVATSPVGLDEIIRVFETFMGNQPQNEDKKVKIVGLGGSGKATLAAEFFNRESPSFEKTSFLPDLRALSNRNALPSLLSKFLKDLQLGDKKIDSVSEGKGFIREKLKSLILHMSIVLDDIDHPDRVEALLVEDMLGSGSLIIITSSDEGVVKLSGASIYSIKALCTDHAQDLFCHYGFQQCFPLVKFEDLVEKLCGKCGGLALFSKVIGAHPRINVMNVRQLWEDELKHTYEDILKILNTSYNSLSEQEKNIFLDIAWFFTREDKNLANKVWDKRGLLRLNSLANKCLMEFDSNNCFKMHAHVRDFGREIADEESPRRMWNKSQAANFGEQPQATKKFRGIMAARTFDLEWYKPPLEEIELSALKILIVKGDCFEEQIGRKLKNLVWLRWFEFKSCLRYQFVKMSIPASSISILIITGS